MTKDRITDYCSALSTILLETKVSDRPGRRISLDHGGKTVINQILEAKGYSRKVMVIGNGGSAAIAAHTQNDLSKAVGIKAMVFDDSSLLTALANDHGYGCVYERSVEQWAEPGDILIAISSSGQSENIVRAVKAADALGCYVITLSGFKSDNSIRRLGDINFYVPVSDYGYVESAHAVLAHYFTDSAVALTIEEPASSPSSSKIVNLIERQR